MSEEWRFRELLEAVPEAIIEVDADGRIVLLNGMTEKLFGYPREELLGQPLGILVPEPLREKHSRHHARYWRNPTTRPMGSGLVLKGQRKDGTHFPVEISLSPRQSSRGLGVLAIIRDISDRKQAEDRFRTIQERYIAQLRGLGGALQKAREEERKKVVRTIHDELGQALTAIKIDVSRLKQEFPLDRKDWAETAESILELVDRTIRSVRRMATELRPGILDDLGLTAALEWAAEEFEAHTKTKCRLRLPKSDLRIDPEQATQLFRIFQETLTNIMRHANATRVDVRLSQDDAALTLEVQDNGIGVAEDQLSSNESFGILGMKERVLLLGGELSIKGEPRKGTTVRVQIPMNARPAGSGDH